MFAGVRVSPQLGFFHDVQGRAAERGVRHLSFTESLSSTVRYTWYFGGGVANPLSDRDNLQLNIAYDF